MRNRTVRKAADAARNAGNVTETAPEKRAVIKAADAVFALSLLIALISAFLYLSAIWKDYAITRYWRGVAEKRTQSGDNWTRESVSPRLRALYDENPDIVGWLTMESAKIDYPIMQTTRDDPEHYLHRNFHDADEPTGTPFADYRCQIVPVQGFNTVIYAHDYVFKWLYQYDYTVGYYDAHKYLRFETLAESGDYEVVAAFYADAGQARILDPWNADDPQAYAFYNYLEIDSPEGFRTYADMVRRNSILERDADFNADDRLITLVCCASENYSGIRENGRYVVIAKRLNPGADEAEGNRK